MATKHTNLIKYALVKLSPKAVVWQNDTGAAMSMDGQRIIRYGKKGSADILGFIKGSGIFLNVEVKIPPDKQSPDQINYMEVCRKGGGLYYVVRSEKDVDLLAETL